jgi:hypothetical protein
LTEGDGVGAGIGVVVGFGVCEGEGDAVCPEQPASVMPRAVAAAMDITCFKVITA